MRSARFVMTQADGFHTVSRALVGENVLTRDAIRQFNVLDDGSVVIACAAEGNLDRARRILEDQPDVLSHDVSAGGSSGEVYVRLRPPETIERFFQTTREHEIWFDLPLEVLSTDVHDVAVRATMIAETDETLQRALATLPEDVEIAIERLGPHRPDGRDALSGLTERQREVLQTALDMGYYETPRQSTHEEIAEHVDLEPGTISKHLQRIEARTLKTLAE